MNALLVAGLSLVAIGCNDAKKRDQTALWLLTQAINSPTPCTVSTAPIYEPINGLRAGCDQYIFGTYNQSVSSAGSYVTSTFQNTGVSTDKHGISFPENIDLSVLSAGSDASQYSLEFDFDRGADILGSHAITLKTSDGSIFSQTFSFPNGTVPPISLSALIYVSGPTLSLSAVTNISELSMVFGLTGGANTTVKVRNLYIYKTATPAISYTIATGLSQKTFSNNIISAFYIANPTQSVPLSVTPTPTVTTLQLTNPDQPEFNNTVFTIANDRLEIRPTVFPVPSQSDSNFLVGFPGSGKSLGVAGSVNTARLMIGMKRTGTFNMKIHILPKNSSNWFTIKTYNQNGVAYSENYSVLTLPIRSVLTATEQASFDAVAGNGVDKIFIEFYNNTVGGNGSMEVGYVDVIP